MTATTFLSDYFSFIKKDVKERYYVYPWYINVILFFVYLIWISNSPLYTSVLNYSHINSDPFDWTILPIAYVPNFSTLDAEDRDKKYSELDPEIFIDIPTYDAKVFWRNIDDKFPWDAEYEETVLSRFVYMTPYMGTYLHDHKEYAGSHLAIDIKSPIWTPIRSISNWVVVRVESQPTWYGNFVVIRHDDALVWWEKMTLYSGYAHMDEIYIKQWTKIAKWDVIWAVWDTGITVGSHLHFQIDLASSPFHLFWPFTWEDARLAWVNFFDAVSVWLGKWKALKNTIHPMNFVYENIHMEAEEQTIAMESAPEEWIPILPIQEVPYEEVIDVENIELPLDAEEIEVAVLESAPEIVVEKAELVESWDIEIVSFDDGIKLSSSWDDLVLEDIPEIAFLWEGSEITSSDIFEEERFNVPVVSSTEELEQMASLEVIPREEEKDRTVTLTEEEFAIADELGNFDDLAVTNPFVDVEPSYKYFAAISYFKNNGIISWYSDNSFQPDSKVSRVESLKIILSGFWLAKSPDKTNHFRDIGRGSWQQGYVNKFVEMWILDTENSKFSPNRQISRVEWLKIVAKLGWVDMDDFVEQKVSLRDVWKTKWYYPYVVYSVMNDLLDFINESFNPDASLTRWELVELMYRVING